MNYSVKKKQLGFVFITRSLSHWGTFWKCICFTAIWECYHVIWPLLSSLACTISHSELLSGLESHLCQSIRLHETWVRMGVWDTPERRPYWDGVSCLHWACLCPNGHWALLALHFRKMTGETYEQSSMSHRNKNIMFYSDIFRALRNPIQKWHIVTLVSLWPTKLKSCIFLHEDYSDLIISDENGS